VEARQRKDPQSIENVRMLDGDKSWRVKVERRGGRKKTG
jgi:hypothetical protein